MIKVGVLKDVIYKASRRAPWCSGTLANRFSARLEIGLAEEGVDGRIAEV